MVATDGGIFTFGDAGFFGSAGDIKLAKPVVGIAPTRTGNGYYLVASDGGIFTFGDAVFRGSAGGIKLNAPIVGMDVTPSGNGYQFVATDGGIFNFGDSQFQGSMGGTRLNEPMLGMAIRPAFGVKVDAFDSSNSSSPGSADSEWRVIDGDERLVLQKNSGGVAAGARVYGVEGLDVSQLRNIGFTIESGGCTPYGPRFDLFFDADRDGNADGSKVLSCATGGGGAAKSWDPVAQGVPGNAIVTALDLIHGADGTTVALDDIVVAGLTVGDNSVVRAI
jgi:ribosomal protein L24E